MLQSLKVENFVLVVSLELEFASGFSVLTGETGAGKSILFDALMFVTGARPRAEYVRTGCECAEVSAMFALGPEHEVIARLLQQELLEVDLRAQEVEVVLRRTLSTQGRCKSYVNGKLVSSAQYEQLCAGLVECSTQHDQESRLFRGHHAALVDGYLLAQPTNARQPDYRTQLVDARASYVAARTAENELKSARERSESARDRLDMLRFHLGELQQLALEPGEYPELRALRDRVRHRVKIEDGLAHAENLLDGEDNSAYSALSGAAQALREIVTLDDRAASWVETATRLAEESRALMRELSIRFSDDDNEMTLNDMETRLHSIEKAMRRHSVHTDQMVSGVDLLLRRQEQLQEEAAQLEDCADAVARCEKRFAEASADAIACAEKVRKKRRVGAVAFQSALEERLTELGMPGARIELRFREEERAKVLASIDAADEGELYFAANPGEEMRPLRKVASGGELSRVLLAIRGASRVSGASLVLFDEIDAGVSGKVAERIGLMLAHAAETQQVLAITHQAQVAVFAKEHFHAEKHTENARTSSSFRRLVHDESVAAVSELMGGNVAGDARVVALKLFERAEASLRSREPSAETTVAKPKMEKKKIDGAKKLSTRRIAA